MSDYEDNNSGSDSDVDEEFPRVSKLKKPFKKPRKEVEVDEESEDENSVRSEDDDENEIEDSDLESVSDIEEGDVLETGTKSASHQSNFMNMDFDEDEEEEDYLQRFDESTRNDIISEHHPELQIHNYTEVAASARIVKDDQGRIIDPLHKTLPFLTKYERARILGERAKQLNSGAEPFVQVEPDIIDGYIIAQRELEEKKIPFILKRPLPDGGCEYWRLRDLEIL